MEEEGCKLYFLPDNGVATLQSYGSSKFAGSDVVLVANKYLSESRHFTDHGTLSIPNAYHRRNILNGSGTGTPFGTGYYKRGNKRSTHQVLVLNMHMAGVSRQIF